MYLDAQQNLDVVRQDVVHLDAMHLLDVVVGAELRHQLKMDYCQDVVDVEVHRLQKMDCCLDEEPQVFPGQVELLVLSVWNLHERLLPAWLLEQLLHLRPLPHAMP